MGHSRIKMELIKKESTRIQTFHKRKKSLVKKISEFSILCGVEACMIIFGPKLQDEAAKLDTVWPSNSDAVKNIIDKYKTTYQTRKSYNIADYFSDKKKKLGLEISKFNKQIYEAKYPCWDIRLDKFTEDELTLLVSKLDDKIYVAEQKLNSFQENRNKSKMLQMSENPSNFQLYPSMQPMWCWPGPSSYYNQTELQLLSYSNSIVVSRSDVPIWNNNSSSWWKWENAEINEVEGSIRNLQTMWPQMQVPIPSLPYHQMLPSQADKFSYKFGFENQN